MAGMAKDIAPGCHQQRARPAQVGQEMRVLDIYTPPVLPGWCPAQDGAMVVYMFPSPGKEIYTPPFLQLVLGTPLGAAVVCISRAHRKSFKLSSLVQAFRIARLLRDSDNILKASPSYRLVVVRKSNFQSCHHIQLTSRSMVRVVFVSALCSPSSGAHVIPSHEHRKKVSTPRTGEHPDLASTR